MAEQNLHIHYSAEDIERYLKGKMSAKEMHNIERAALQDPFLADAIDGFSYTSFEESRKHLNEITAALQVKKEETRVVPLRSKTFYWWRVAAIIILVAGISAVSWYIIGSNNAVTKNEIALVKENKSKLADTAAKSGSKNETVKSDSTQTLLAQNNAHSSSQKRTKKNDHAQKHEESPAASSMRAQPSAQKNSKTIVADSVIAENKDATGNISSLSHDTPRQQKTLAISKSNERLITAKENFADSAYPSGGWRLFQEYVYKKLGKPLDTLNNQETPNIVQLEFSVDESGAPYNFSVLKSMNDEIVSKVIETIKNGPGWIATSKNKKGRVTIRF